MEYQLPLIIDLTDAEMQLYEKLPQSVLDVSELEGRKEIADAMERLFISLRQRNAIPENRLKVFTDPKYAAVGTKSMKQIFEQNGTRGKDILRHGAFLELLHFFIRGADLPRYVQVELVQIVNDDWGSTGRALKYVRNYARSLDRNTRARAKKEFFRFAIDIGLDPYDARSFRKAVMSAR